MNIGYKKLQNGYIAELEILGEMDKNRNGIVDPQYALYRASKVKVLKIFHMDNETQVIEQMDDTDFVYIVGKEIDRKVCLRKILHYFKTLEPTKMWKLNVNNYTGKYMEWYDDGNKKCEGEYKDGKKEGKWTGWYENEDEDGNGNKMYEWEYKDGKKEGKHLGWYERGNKKYEGEYKDGKLEGKWIGWWENGNKEFEGEYKDGEKVGKWIGH